jgi:hypothetical protein
LNYAVRRLDADEVLDMVLWMREFIKSGKGRVQFTGFDMQTPDVAAVFVREFVARVEPDYTEQILANYTEPNLDVRYEVISYKGGHVGMIEVLRNQQKLPYKVAKSLGDKCRITENQIFVRHGSQTESPSDAELNALRKRSRTSVRQFSLSLDSHVPVRRKIPTIRRGTI